MAQKLNREQVAAKAIVHAEAAVREHHQVDRNFGLPTALYAMTVGLFLAYLAIMGIGFAHPEMILPMAAFAIAIVAGFGVPALWARMKPDDARPPLSWSSFICHGIETHTGRVDSTAASVQVLILPVLIFLWGIATVSIAAIVQG